MSGLIESKWSEFEVLTESDTITITKQYLLSLLSTREVLSNCNSLVGTPKMGTPNKE